MEKLKKKKKFYFPYKIFNVERNSKSQTNIFSKEHSTINSTNLINKKTIEVNNFVKKLKSTILSSKIFSKYMDNYIGQTQDFSFKSPGNTVYPLKKNFQYLPITFQKSQIIDELMDVSKKDNEIDNEKDNEKDINSVIEKSYGFKYKKTKIVINRDKDFYHQNSEEKKKSKIFMSFSEGNFYSNELLKTFDLNNIDINNNIEIIKSNFEYLQESIININSLENFINENSIEFKIKSLFNKEAIQFNMHIFSLCFKFYEIHKEENKLNDNSKVIKKYKLYLPFKLLPFFYLLNYSYFKNFISEIIYYDKEKKEMDFNQDKFRQVLQKYSIYLTNIYQKNQNEKFQDITFYKNEFAYNNYYDWIIINEKDNKNKESIIYKMKIVFPKVIFEDKNNKIKVINHLNKNIIIKILKKCFIDWEKLVLFDLFSHKQFRFLINNILIGGKKYYDKTLKLYENKAYMGLENTINIKSINKTFNNFIQSNKNYEFFITEGEKKKSYYYKFIPNIILILIGETKKKFQKINLNLKESRKLYELSKYWGAINTLFKCMYKDEMNNKIYFKLNILEDMPKELYKIIKNEKINFRETFHYKNNNVNSASNSNKEKSNFTRYKSNEIELVLFECLLNTINIDINEAKLLYYKVPNKLLSIILTCNNNMKIVNCIIDCYDEIINNVNNIDIINEEKNMNKKVFEVKRGNSPNEKYRFERHPTMGLNPSKTFNKNKTFFIKNNSGSTGNIYYKSFNKQKSSFENTKNNYLNNKIEKKNTDGMIEQKNINISNFIDYPNKNNNENNRLPIIPNVKIAEANNGDMSQNNNQNEFGQKRFSRNLKKNN